MSDQVVKLPSQLATLIHGEAREEEEDAGRKQARKGRKKNVESNARLNGIVAASQNRHIKELSSYVRAICMRLGLFTADDDEL